MGMAAVTMASLGGSPLPLPAALETQIEFRLPLAGWVTSDLSVSVRFLLCPWEYSSACLVQGFKD